MEVHGAGAVARLREQDPATYLRIAASLVPRDFLSGSDEESVHTADNESASLKNGGAKSLSAFVAEIHKLLDTSQSSGERLKALQLLAEVSGLLQKPKASDQTVNNHISHVMIVPHHGSEREWESATMEQQRNLVRDTQA